MDCRGQERVGRFGAGAAGSMRPGVSVRPSGIGYAFRCDAYLAVLCPLILTTYNELEGGSDRWMACRIAVRVYADLKWAVLGS